MRKEFRLNQKGCSIYALFIIEEDRVTFRKFKFYTGPQMDNDKVITLEEGRELYRQMLNEKTKFLPFDPTDDRVTNKWVKSKKEK